MRDKVREVGARGYEVCDNGNRTSDRDSDMHGCQMVFIKV